VDEIGLSIKLDSRKVESTDLNKAVVVTEVRILHLKPYELEPYEVRNWKTAILSTPVYFGWLNYVIFKHFTNLRVLILNEDALTVEEYGGCRQPEVNHCFNLLSELHISLSQNGFQDGLAKLLGQACRGLDYVDIGVQLYFFAMMKARVQKNITTLLKIIRSRVLKLLFVSVMGLDEPTEEQISQDYQPLLLEFLENHRHSLETLISRNLLIGKPHEENGSVLNTIQLKRIRLATAGRKTPSNCWIDLLLHQRTLEQLSLNIRQYPNDSPFPWLASVVYNSITTLTDICLQFDLPSAITPGELQKTLDMRLFLATESLRSLEVETTYRVMTILNLNDVPTKSLTKLRINGANIATDFDGIKFLESFNPTELHLDGVSGDGLFKDRIYTFEFIKLALRCRNLDYFYFLTTKMKQAFPESSVDESLLEPWILQLEADESIPNFAGCQVNFIRTIPEIAKVRGTKSNPVDSGTKWTLLASMSYMYTLEFDCIHDGDGNGPYHREPPFHLPRNVETFLVWINKQTYTYRILPNTNSHFKKSLKDMGQCFMLSVMLESSSDGEVGPGGLKDLGIMEDTLTNEAGANLTFIAKDFVLFKLSE